MKEDWEKTAQEQNDEDDYLLDDDDDVRLDEYCPKCGLEYDEIDFDYQICHRCKYNNNKP